MKKSFGNTGNLTRTAVQVAALAVIVIGQRVDAQRVVSVSGEEGPVAACLKPIAPGNSIQCTGGLLTSAPFVEQKYFEHYAGDLSVGNVIAFTFGGDRANLYSELVGANLHLGVLGYARAGFGALVAANEDSTATTADQFFDGGGNASFYIALPLYYRLSAVREQQGAPFLSRRVDTYLVTSVGADLPALNAAAADRHSASTRATNFVCPECNG